MTRRYRGRHRVPSTPMHVHAQRAGVVGAVGAFALWPITQPTASAAPDSAWDALADAPAAPAPPPPAPPPPAPAPVPTPTVDTGGEYTPPTVGRLTSGFGPRWGTTHYGIDIANSIGTPIRAVADGVVISAGPADGFGLWVRLQHPTGSITTYGHVNTIDVDLGETVYGGEQIATMGNRGQSTGPHLHFEVTLPGGQRVDPLPWLRDRGIADFTGASTPDEDPAPATPGAPDDQDCADFPGRANAEAHLSEDPADPDDLDQDGDGQACEGWFTPPEPTVPEPEPVEPGEPVVVEPRHGESYVVVPGDTLSEIAERFEVETWEALYGRNRHVVGDNPHLIFPGQTLDVAP